MNESVPVAVPKHSSSHISLRVQYRIPLTAEMAALRIPSSAKNLLRNSRHSRGYQITYELPDLLYSGTVPPMVHTVWISTKTALHRQILAKPIKHSQKPTELVVHHRMAQEYEF